MACEYCKNQHENIVELVDASKGGCGTAIGIWCNQLVAASTYDGGRPIGGDAFVNINYCPMCGEKLGDTNV